MTTLVHNQELLQHQALAIINKLNLQTTLREFGEVNTVGSALYGLMTWRDIDIDLVMDETPTDEDFWHVGQKIFPLPGINSITLIDNRHSTEINRPKSIYIGLRYTDDQNSEWKIDIRLLAKVSVTSDSTSQLINKKLTPESKQIILEIKSQIHDHPDYHQAFSSVDIYQAVLIHNVKNLDDFKIHLKKIGKNCKSLVFPTSIIKNQCLSRFF